LSTIKYRKAADHAAGSRRKTTCVFSLSSTHLWLVPPKHSSDGGRRGAGERRGLNLKSLPRKTLNVLSNICLLRDIITALFI
jgi:hypothetical protein